MSIRPDGKAIDTTPRGMRGRGNPATEVVTVKDLRKIPNIPAPGARPSPVEPDEAERVLSVFEAYYDPALIGDRGHPRVSLTPDPRLSTGRPAWCAGDDWRAQLDAMTYEDTIFLAESWELAGGAKRWPDDTPSDVRIEGAVVGAFVIIVVVLTILTVTGVLR
jgi:hypothetical protein